MLNRLGEDHECDRQTDERTDRVKPYSADRPISIKFSTDYDHVPPDLPQTFKVNGSDVKVVA